MVVVGTDHLNEGQPMKKLLVALIVGGCFQVVVSASPCTCLASEPGDSEAFGYALAVSEDYLAVGDWRANRVVLYQRDARGRWTRREEILPPVGSTVAEAGAGFGSALDLDGETLVIGAYYEIVLDAATRIKNRDHRGIEWVSGIFTVNLANQLDGTSSNLEASSISSNPFLQDAVYGFDVSIDEKFIAFSINKEVELALWHGYVGILPREKPWQEPEIIAPPEGGAMEHFAVSIDLANGLLIAAAPRAGGGHGNAYLFNLTTRSGWEQLLKDENFSSMPPNGWFGGEVALSENLAFLGGKYRTAYGTSAAVITISDNDESTVSYVFPGGPGSVDQDVAVIAAGLPGRWSQMETFPPLKDAPRLNIVNQSGVHPVMVDDPYTGKPIAYIQTVALGEDFVLLTQKYSSLKCQVLTVPTTTLLNRSSSTSHESISQAKSIGVNHE